MLNAKIANCFETDQPSKRDLWLHSQLGPERPLCLPEQNPDKQNTEGN